MLACLPGSLPDGLFVGLHGLVGRLCLFLSAVEAAAAGCCCSCVDVVACNLVVVVVFVVAVEICGGVVL